MKVSGTGAVPMIDEFTACVGEVSVALNDGGPKSVKMGPAGRFTASRWAPNTLKAMLSP